MRRYGVLDLLFAFLYGYFGFVLTPGRSRPFNLALAFLIGLMVLSGVGLLLRSRWGRWSAIITSILLLGFAAVVVLLLVASSAYLRGIYGPLGKGLAVVTLLVAALVVEGFALLPLFQLRFLLGHGRG